MNIIIIFQKRIHVWFNDDGLLLLLLLPFYFDSWYLLNPNVVHNNSTIFIPKRKSHHNTYKVNIYNICVAFTNATQLLRVGNGTANTCNLLPKTFSIYVQCYRVWNAHHDSPSKDPVIQWTLIKYSQFNTQTKLFPKHCLISHRKKIMEAIIGPFVVNIQNHELLTPN